MSSFKTSLLTPDGSLFDGQVVSLNLPGSEGNFQVLQNHASFMSTLDVGTARIETAENTSKLFALSGGFVEVNNNTVVILAEVAEPVSAIDIERAKASKERAEARLKEAGIDRVRAEASLKRAINRLKLTGSI